MYLLSLNYLWAFRRYSHTPFCSCYHSNVSYTTQRSPRQHDHLAPLDTSYYTPSHYRVYHHSKQIGFHCVDHLAQSSNADSDLLEIYHKQSSFLICLLYWQGLHHSQGNLCEHFPSWGLALRRTGRQTCNRSCHIHPIHLGNLRLGIQISKKKLSLLKVNDEYVHVWRTAPSIVHLTTVKLITKRRARELYALLRVTGLQGTKKNKFQARPSSNL